MKTKIFAEIGYGNNTFLSTEIERGKYEYRLPFFIFPKTIKGIYFRCWIFKKVLVLSTRNGVSIVLKDRKKLKILFGIEGDRR